MKNTLFFGNGLNRISKQSVSWDSLLDRLKGDQDFSSKTLPYTMVYERIFIQGPVVEGAGIDELQVKCQIADALKAQGGNFIYDKVVSMDFDNYLTTNYDYAIEEALIGKPDRKSTEDVYSVRRKRTYETDVGVKTLWNVHGQVEHPKSIMLGMDHYCGAVGKIGSYIKGTYEHVSDGVIRPVASMREKLESGVFCNTSWIDLFFSSNVHIVGFSLDFSEIDIWWLLNKRARFAAELPVMNKIFFYTDRVEVCEKTELLSSFGVQVVVTSLKNDGFPEMYRRVIKKMERTMGASAVPPRPTEVAK